LAPAVISSVRWENGMILAGVEQPAPGPQRVAPGDAALVRLTWLTDTPLTQRYKVSVQLLGATRSLQHDSEPADGASHRAWQGEASATTTASPSAGDRPASTA
jgi:hypothetical protein